MKYTAAFGALLGLATMAQAHMEMIWPPPLRSKYNPHSTNIDYTMNSPLEPDGSNFPCKGHHSVLSTAQGKPVVEWQAGQTYNFTVTGTATHGGGSCQASLSYDGGKTWTVIHSYIGNCPLTPTWEFALPPDTQAGEALFAWSWFNQIGNREMYMNCAPVTIRGSANKRAPDGGRKLSQRPAMFVANVANGCETLEGADLEFPEPGPDVSKNTYRTTGPVGNCGSYKKRSARTFRS
ncbi:putative extracellular protein [Sodiomyces alkalinus F11]|uniref:Putative extracellular protein n=1 Tax=Sodiomyces alkalinus (strain CBS 110278 / VKM F-3762 / F11) TaxID=1314773 RepID=A0A3N2Q150_SODAK|nr:putative extracellular protein [Sodiomyces alkalinus F11]ROT40487.1 putative extracellular protein [Sodiomyces alkalinus F11]